MEEPTHGDFTREVVSITIAGVDKGYRFIREKKNNEETDKNAVPQTGSMGTHINFV